MNIARKINGLLVILVCFSLPTAAQEQVEKLPPKIRVSGEATVMAKPDQLQLDLGVVTQAQTSETAAAQNARQLDAVLAELRKALGPAAEIETISYTLHPNYQYPREGGKPTVTGYTATNLVRVTLNDLTAAGKAIDAATQTGANQIRRLQFKLKDEQATQARALREAAAKARAQAEALANALGVNIVRVLSAVEGNSSVQPVRDVMLMSRAEAAAPTPIEPGAIEVRAAVTLTVEISAR
jgi:uncharacterized protein